MIPRRPISALCRRLGRLWRREDGAVTIEFVFYYPLVLAIIFMSFEVSVTMIRQTMLEHALDEATRGLRLGVWPNIDHAGFKAQVCANTDVIPDCENTLKIQMFPISKVSWDLPEVPLECVDRREELAPVVHFNQGPDNGLMLLRACATVDPFMPGFGVGYLLERAERDGYYLTAYTVFVNEPGAGS